MAETWKTFGHEHVKRILDLQISSGRFAHAYLFLGPKFLGKKMLALEFAAKILSLNGQNGFTLQNHPDYLMFDCEAETDIEKVRLFMQRLSWKPFSGKYKTAVINGFENLNLQSQNALLKTLEEPSPSTVLMLISSQTPLSTVVSRCQVLKFNRLTAGQIKVYCKNFSLNADERQVAAAFGAPGRLNEINTNTFLDAWLKAKELSTALRQIKFGALAEEESGELSESLKLAALYETGKLKEKPLNFKLVASLLCASEDLKKNLNKKMVLQKLALSI